MSSRIFLVFLKPSNLVTIVGSWEAQKKYAHRLSLKRKGTTLKLYYTGYMWEHICNNIFMETCHYLLWKIHGYIKRFFFMIYYNEATMKDICYREQERSKHSYGHPFVWARICMHDIRVIACIFFNNIFFSHNHCKVRYD